MNAFISVAAVVCLIHLLPGSDAGETVGTLNGKSFWVEHTFLSNDKAAEYCENQNMKLAAIESEEEFEFLKSSAGGYFDGYFWIAKAASDEEPDSWEEDTCQFFRAMGPRSNIQEDDCRYRNGIMCQYFE